MIKAMIKAMIKMVKPLQDRSAIAITNRKRIQHIIRTGGWIDRIRVQTQELSDSSDHELRSLVIQLRQSATGNRGIREDDSFVLAASLVTQSIRRTLNKQIFDTQLHAGLVVSLGGVAEMQTGEGKTIAGAIPAFIRALDGRGVHVATTNDYLATRDQKMLATALGNLGLTSSLLQDTMSLCQKREAYQADITYGSSHSFGFDYLRDRLMSRPNPSEKMGDRVFAIATHQDTATRPTQRRLSSAIIDEIDHVLIDDATSPLLLNSSPNDESRDADVHRQARQCSDQLILGDDFIVTNSEQIKFTTRGFERVYGRAENGVLKHRDLVRPWHEYVALAIRAEKCFHRDVHYVIQSSQIQLVDRSTGRIFADRTWSDGLQQAIEAKEQLSIRSETRPLGRITRQSFFRLYRFLGGMTGTADGCHIEFASTYGLHVEPIPLRVASRRVCLPDHYSRTIADKHAAIVDETEAMMNTGRAVLIGTLSIAESQAIARQLELRGLGFELLNGIQDAQEASLVARAGRCRSITVATSLAGRGTDICLDDGVIQAGGLHVIVSQRHSLARVDRQLIGRSARCGDPGSSRIFVSAEDPIPSTVAPWIGRAILRLLDGDGNHDGSLRVKDRHFDHVQSRYQSEQSAARKRVLEDEEKQQRLFATTPTTMPDRCWQL
jgi:preprotein translocase subunit SecA